MDLVQFFVFSALASGKCQFDPIEGAYTFRNAEGENVFVTISDDGFFLGEDGAIVEVKKVGDLLAALNPRKHREERILSAYHLLSRNNPCVLFADLEAKVGKKDAWWSISTSPPLLVLSEEKTVRRIR
jgi:hypothetical protein